MRTLLPCEVAHEACRVSEALADAVDTPGLYLRILSCNQTLHYDQQRTSDELAIAASSPALPLRTVACHVFNRPTKEDFNECDW